jgi:hypothetical protein
MPNLRYVRMMPRKLNKQVKCLHRALLGAIEEAPRFSEILQESVRYNLAYNLRVKSLLESCQDHFPKSDDPAWKLYDDFRAALQDEIKPSFSDAIETVRLAQYNALGDLAEHYGFRRDQIGVDISFAQPSELGKISFDMQMPAELASILHDKGFFDAQS